MRTNLLSFRFARSRDIDKLPVSQSLRIERHLVHRATSTARQSNAKVNVPPRGGELPRVEALLHWIEHLHVIDIGLGNVVPARNDAVLLGSGVPIPCSAVAAQSIDYNEEQ